MTLCRRGPPPLPSPPPLPPRPPCAAPGRAAGVVSIPGPSPCAGVSAIEAVPSIPVPALFIAAENDYPFAGDAQALYQACGTKDKKLSMEPGGFHGTALLNDHVSALIDAF